MNTSCVSIRRRAMTLVELTVTTALMAVLGALALGIMSQSDRATRTVTGSQAAWQYAQRSLDRARAAVETAVDPASLGGPLAAGPVMSRDLLRLVVAAPEGAKPALGQVTISGPAPQGTGSPAPAGLVYQAQALGGPSGLAAQGAGRRDELGGVAPERFTPAIRFGYAARVEPGQPPRFADTWTSPGLPALIQITVTAQVEDDPEHPVELCTAAIPGLLPEPQPQPQEVAKP